MIVIGEQLTSYPRGTEDALTRAGKHALNVGLLHWSHGIMDPTRKAWDDPAFADDRKFIDDCIRSPSGLGWGRCSAFTGPYRWDGDYEWCGAFAARCWSHSIGLAIRKRYFPSTYRLNKYGQHKRAFIESVPTVAPEHRRKWLAIDGDADDIDDFGPRAGDILIVNGKGYGQHITIVERWDPDLMHFLTVEGNATGKGPKGERYQGVVRQVRPLAVCRRLIRPGLCDLIGAPA